jgi:hypothetical protein
VLRARGPARRRDRQPAGDLRAASAGLSHLISMRSTGGDVLHTVAEPGCTAPFVGQVRSPEHRVVGALGGWNMKTELWCSHGGRRVMTASKRALQFRFSTFAMLAAFLSLIAFARSASAQTNTPDSVHTRPPAHAALRANTAAQTPATTPAAPFPTFPLVVAPAATAANPSPPDAPPAPGATSQVAQSPPTSGVAPDAEPSPANAAASGAGPPTPAAAPPRARPRSAPQSCRRTSRRGACSFMRTASLRR